DYYCCSYTGSYNF
nr:immunoglobulin light chain junction region [Macaca mulatta]